MIYHRIRIKAPIAESVLEHIRSEWGHLIAKSGVTVDNWLWWNVQETGANDSTDMFAYLIFHFGGSKDVQGESDIDPGSVIDRVG